MNIWAWVRETRERLEQGDPPARHLAELMRDLPSAAADEAHERVDGMAPEALALARELEEPWAELFIRHWSLQSRILHRRQAGDELREAVSLLDFASGPRTRACPQSVCAVQDLAVCYAIRDGPGYVGERLAVARETLERIDPSWACFDCITAEYFSAVMDDGRAREALEFIEARLAEQAEHGEFEPGFNMITNRARALTELGRPAQALALLDSVRGVARYGRSRQMSYRQQRVTVLLALGRVEQALALHPPLSAIRATAGHFRDWVDNSAALVNRGRIPNTAALGRELLEVQRRFETNGARWDTASTALIGARLALARGAREVARLLLEDFDRVRAQLRRPELLAERRRSLGEQLDAATRARQREAGSGDEDELAARDPERALDRLRETDSATRTDDPALVLERAAALRGIGRADRARALLEAQLDDQLETGASEGVILELARALLAERDHAALDALIGERLGLVDPCGNDDGEGDGAGGLELGAQLSLAWIYGQSLRERGELRRALDWDRAMLRRAPELLPLRLRLARSARELGEWETALAALNQAAAALEPGEVDWDRITAATVLGRWATVREAAARLGVPTSGSGDAPIEHELGLIRCEFVEASGRRERYWARRTSPCGARVIEIAMPGDPQHYEDWVVFEPRDLEAHARQESEQHRPCFEVVAILEPGRRRAFLLRGFDPGRQRFEALRERVYAAGYGFERITAEGRSAADPRVDASLEQDPGGAGVTPEVATVAVLVALEQEQDPARLRELILDATADWELPLLAPKLDAAAGEARVADEAAALLERWKP